MKKKKTVEPVSKTELQILDVLWEGSPRTIREVCEKLYGDTSGSLYATVQSLLVRLEEKGWVDRDRSAFRHTFSPARSRSDLIGQQIQQIADSVCDGSIVALLGELGVSKALTAKERKELRKLIDGGKE